MKPVLAVACLVVGLGGCAGLANLLGTTVYAPGGWVYGSSEQPIDPDMKENMPWQLGPSSPKTLAAHDEPIQIVTVQGWGPVKARADILRTFPQPLASAPGPNRTVEACRDQATRAGQLCQAEEWARTVEGRHSRSTYLLIRHDDRILIDRELGKGL